MKELRDLLIAMKKSKEMKDLFSSLGRPFHCFRCGKLVIRYTAEFFNPDGQGNYCFRCDSVLFGAI